MYYIGKILQALGMVIILAGFIQRFPELMSHTSLMIGTMIFAAGWLIDRFLLKR